MVRRFGSIFETSDVSSFPPCISIRYLIYCFHREEDGTMQTVITENTLHPVD